MNRQTAVIIGAGPAGLTAALELERRTGIRPVVIEATDAIGGISRTIRYKGNRMDIGGHRFFSKSDRVMEWWLGRLPVERTGEAAHKLGYHGSSRFLRGAQDGPDPARELAGGRLPAPARTGRRRAICEASL